MPLLGVGAVNSADFETPVEVGLVEVGVGLEVVKDLGEESFGGDDDDGLRAADLVILIGDILLAEVRYVVKRVQQRNEVSQGLASPVVGVDDDTQVLEVVLKRNGKRLGLHQGGLLVVVILEQVDHLGLDGVMLELRLLALRVQVELLPLLLRIFLHPQIL